MPEYAPTLIAALIGAVIGSVGAVLTGHLLARRMEARRRREALAQRYLFQLQDAVEALWYRLDNLAYQGGRYVMADPYFQSTTLYALGRVLAIERILVLEGVYPQLEAAYPKLGEFLREHRIERELQDAGLYQYDRVSLAEAVIEREGDRFRTSTYLEFRRRYEAEGSLENKWLTPAKEATEHLNKNKLQMEALLASLYALAKRTAKETGVSSSLKDRSNGKPTDSPNTL